MLDGVLKVGQLQKRIGLC